MKKIAILIVLIFGSCEYEPVDPTIEPNPPAPPVLDVTGVYNLIAYNTATKTDLDLDGIFSTNQMDETICHDANRIEVYANNTFFAPVRTITIITDENLEEVMDCTYKPELNGTWSIFGNTVTFSYVQGGTNKSFQCTFSNGELTTYESNAKVVATNDLGEPVYIYTDLTKIYKR